MDGINTHYHYKNHHSEFDRTAPMMAAALWHHTPQPRPALPGFSLKKMEWILNELSQGFCDLYTEAQAAV